MSQNDANGKTPTVEEQVSAYKSFATTDGEPSDGGDHPEEVAAAESRAEAARVAAAAEKASATKTAPKPTTLTEDVGAEDDTEEFDEGTEQAVAPTDGAPKPKKTAAQRVAEINAATREMREVERRIAEREAAFEARLAGASKGSVAETPQVGVSDAGAPKPDDVDDKGNKLYEYGELDGRYIKAVARYEAKIAYAAEKAADTSRQEQAVRETEQAANRQKLQDLTAKGAEKYEDFDEVVMQGAKAERYPLSEVVGRLILGSEVGADIAYHLASNPQEARQLAGKSPLEQAAYFGRLEARFSAPASGATAAKVAKTTQAPPPIRSARGGGGSTGDPAASSDFAEFERAANAGSRK